MFQRVLFQLLCLFLVVAPIGASAFHVNVEHDLGSGLFIPAGKFKLAKSTQAGRSAKVVLSRIKLDITEKQDFASLVSRDGYYRLRIPGPSQNLGESHAVMSSIHARCIVQARFQENIVLHVDSSENIYSMDLALGSRGCHPGLNVTLPPAWSFATETEVYVRKPALAPVIDAPKLKLVEASEDGTMSGNQADTEHTIGEDGKPVAKKEESKTWLEKNWMLVVFGGMLVMNVLGNAATEGSAHPTGQHKAGMAGTPGRAGAPR